MRKNAEKLGKPTVFLRLFCFFDIFLKKLQKFE